MKSSCKPAPQTLNSTVSAWEPDDIQIPEDDQVAIRAEDVMAMLQAKFGSYPGVHTQEAGGLVQPPELEYWVPNPLQEGEHTEPDDSPSPLTIELESTEDEVKSAATFATAQPREREMASKVLDEVRAEASAIMDEAHEQADTMLSEAHQQAQQIIAEAQTKAEALVEDTRQQALQEGWKQGQAEGLQAAHNETSSMLQTAKEIVTQFSMWREEMLMQSEKAVVEVIKDMAQAMFGEGVVLDSTTLQMNYNRIMENARSLGDLKIYLNPEDAENIGPYWKENQIAITGQQIQIIPSDAIQRGGCFVDGQNGSIDARIETQLKALLESLEPQTKGGTL